MIQRTMKSTDSVLYYDYHAQKLKNQWTFEKAQADLIPFLEELKSNGRILDLGCGSGLDLKSMREAGFEPVGLDASAQMIQFSKELNPEVLLLHKNFLFLTLKEEEFDGVWASHSLSLLSSESAQRVVATCFRGIKRGGVLGIVLEEGEGFYEDRGTDLSGPSRTVYLYSEKAICSMLEQTGFQILKVGRKKSPAFEKAELLILAKRI